MNGSETQRGTVDIDHTFGMGWINGLNKLLKRWTKRIISVGIR